MGRTKRGGYLFIWFKGDHAPAHVHVYRDGRLVTKYDLENNRVMTGSAGTRVKNIIAELREEGVFSELI